MAQGFGGMGNLLKQAQEFQGRLAQAMEAKTVTAQADPFAAMFEGAPLMDVMSDWRADPAIDGPLDIDPIAAQLDIYDVM